ncbi:MAG: flavodoxin family protein [Candidatus Bathyarchaeia archaeon]
MNSVIILFSYHHKNTEKVAQVIAKVIGAEIKTPEQTDPNSLANYELVGFGSGVYFGKLGKTLLELADKIPQATGKKAFIFSTSGRAGKAAAKFHKPLKEKLESKGYTVVGEFNCAAFDTFGPLKIVGGTNKGRPNADDLKQAEAFAQSLLKNEPSVLYVE